MSCFHWVAMLRFFLLPFVSFFFSPPALAAPARRAHLCSLAPVVLHTFSLLQSCAGWKHIKLKPSDRRHDRRLKKRRRQGWPHQSYSLGSQMDDHGSRLSISSSRASCPNQQLQVQVEGFCSSFTARGCGMGWICIRRLAGVERGRVEGVAGGRGWGSPL